MYWRQDIVVFNIKLSLKGHQCTKKENCEFTPPQVLFLNGNM